MKIIDAGYEIMDIDTSAPDDRDYIYQKIERAARTCYKSEANITTDSAGKLIKRLISSGHEAMLEHASMTVKFTVDRGVSHELVRHRVASFAQESTRYCNYSKEKFGANVTFIRPCFLKDLPNEASQYWMEAMKVCEDRYLAMIEAGASPQQARAVLPNSLKTEVVMTANMREWRHFLKLRAVGTTGTPHPQMAEVGVPLLKEIRDYMPELFCDLFLDEELYV